MRPWRPDGASRRRCACGPRWVPPTNAPSLGWDSAGPCSAQGNERQAVLEFHAARSTFERLGAEIDVRRAARAAGDSKRVRGTADGAGVHVHRHRRVHEPGGGHRGRGLGASGPGGTTTCSPHWLPARAARSFGPRVTGSSVTFDSPESAIACAVAIQQSARRASPRAGLLAEGADRTPPAEATKEGTDWSGRASTPLPGSGRSLEGDEILVSSANRRGGRGFGRRLGSADREPEGASSSQSRWSPSSGAERRREPGAAR
mgnify:CR=1 FL=1